jgi:hypothetical protein
MSPLRANIKIYNKHKEIKERTRKAIAILPQLYNTDVSFRGTVLHTPAKNIKKVTRAVSSTE